MTRFFNVCLCLVLFCSTELISADDYDELDLELEFSRHQKSTLENFPMQEIDQEGLSDTAIEGALQVQASESEKSDRNGKPIHEKLKEADQKKQTEEVLVNSENDIVDAKELLKFSDILPAQPQIQPIIYQQPTGRTYTDHQTTTIERP